MISLLKFLEGPWEQVRGYLKEDLEHIQEAINRNWSAAFGQDGTLLSDAIQGDPSEATRYVANTGTDNAPKWDQVNLANGVKGRLDYNHLPQADAETLIGRRDGASGGDYEAISIGDGLEITTGAELRSPIADATLITVDDETATLANSRQLVAGTNVTFDTATPGELEINVSAGASALDDLTDVTAPTPSDGDVLTYDSGTGEWINAAPVAGASALDDLTDVDTSGVADGDALVYDSGSATWIPGASGSGGTTVQAGAMVLLAEKTASSSASLDFATRNAPGQSGAMFQSDFDEYAIEIIGLVPATSLAVPYLRFSTDGGSSYDTGNNYAFSGIGMSNSGSVVGGSQATSFIQLMGYSTTTGILTTTAASGTLFASLKLAQTSGKYPRLVGQSSFIYDNGFPSEYSSWGATYLSTTAVNAFRVIFSSGNITSGIVRVYGIAKGTGSLPATITGNGLVLLEEHTASSSASLDFTTRNVAGQSGATFATDFDEYEIHLIDVVPSTDNVSLYLRLSTDGGSTWLSAASSYFWAYFYHSNALTTGTANDGSAGLTSTAIVLNANVDNSNATLAGVCGMAKIFRPTATANHKYSWETHYLNNTGGTYTVRGFGRKNANTTPVNACQILFSSGNIASGTIRVYGITKTGGATTAELDDLADVTISSPTAEQPLKYDGSGWVNGYPAGSVVQVVNTETGAVATGTTTIPLDDTIPQNTEGDEYMSLSITPKSATNKLKIEVVIYISNSATNEFLTAALFQDSTANALATGMSWQLSSTGLNGIVFTHYMTAGTTSATTFKVRAGGHIAGTTTFNGRSGGRLYGGTYASSITITEIAA